MDGLSALLLAQFHWNDAQVPQWYTYVSTFGLVPKTYLTFLHRTDKKQWDWVGSIGTHGSYVMVVTRFAAAAIRTLSRADNRFKLPLSDGVRSKVEALKASLEKITYQALDTTRKQLPTGKKPKKLLEGRLAVVRALQEFFFSAVTGMVDGSTANRFKCPVLTYVACFSYQPDNTFKTAWDITSLLANWKFLLRVTAIFKAQDTRDDASGTK